MGSYLAGTHLKCLTVRDASAEYLQLSFHRKLEAKDMPMVQQCKQNTGTNRKKIRSVLHQQ